VRARDDDVHEHPIWASTRRLATRRGRPDGGRSRFAAQFPLPDRASRNQ
jgi:hypothetical protein